MNAEKLQVVLDLEAEIAALQVKLDTAKAELDPSIRLRLYGAPKVSDVGVEALDLVTGAVVHSFATLSAAAKMGFTISCIRGCLKGKYQSHRELFWRRVGDTTLPVLRPVEDHRPYLDEFVAANLHEVPGAVLPFKEFFERFQAWLPDDQRHLWSRVKLSRSMPTKFPSGTGNQNITYVINAAWNPGPSQGPRLHIVHGRIKRAA